MKEILDNLIKYDRYFITLFDNYVMVGYVFIVTKCLNNSERLK